MIDFDDGKIKILLRKERSFIFLVRDRFVILLCLILRIEFEDDFMERYIFLFVFL